LNLKNDKPLPLSEENAEIFQDAEIEGRIAQIYKESRLDEFPEKDWSFYNKDHLKNRPKPNPHRLSYADIINNSHNSSLQTKDGGPG
jgi:hypothetical protein